MSMGLTQDLWLLEDCSDTQTLPGSQLLWRYYVFQPVTARIAIIVAEAAWYRLSA